MELIERPSQSLDRELGRHARANAGSSLTLVATTLASPLVERVFEHLDAFREAGCHVHLILGGAALNAGARRRVAEARASLPNLSIRAARFAGAENLVEQLAFGSQLWTRDRDERSEVRALAATPAAVSAAKASFETIAWVSDSLN